jgi:hypothetical protein
LIAVVAGSVVVASATPPSGADAARVGEAEVPAVHRHDPGTQHLHAAAVGSAVAAPGLPSACPGLEAMVGGDGRFIGCTHGGDTPIGAPVPIGEPVPGPVDTALLRSPVMGVAGPPARSGSAEARTSSTASTANGGVPASVAAPTPGVNAAPCEPGDDGSSGRRVHLLYVRDSSSTTPLASVLPHIRTAVGQMDSTLMTSALKTGGRRHIRWLHDGTCVPTVTEVVVGAGLLGAQGGQTAFTVSANALIALGFNRPDRKYLFWADHTTYCGIGHIYGDPSFTSPYNDTFAAMFSRVDRTCWAYPHVPLHELFHNLGAVQPGAPRATTGYHCYDELDVMCYDDGGIPGSGSLLSLCDYQFRAEQLDCGNDTYFHANPAPGSYLATSWNSARSGYLFASPAAEVPVGRLDAYYYAAGAVTEVGSVLANDVNLAPSAMTAELVSQPTGATVTMAPDGTFTYASTNSSLSGTQTFLYRPVVGGWGLPIAVTMFPTQKLTDPTGAPAVSGDTATRTVSWTYPANASATGVEVATSTDGTTWQVQPGLRPLGPASWTDSSPMDQGASRYYRYRGVGNVNSTWSAATLFRPAAPRAPVTPAGSIAPAPRQPSGASGSGAPGGRSPAPASA